MLSREQTGGEQGQRQRVQLGAGTTILITHDGKLDKGVSHGVRESDQILDMFLW